MTAPIVTLTTNWGDSDFFAGMVKGALCRLVEGVRIVDIAHHVDSYNLMAQSFVVRNGCMGFPEGTVHIIDFSTNHNEEHPFLAIGCRGQFFLCADSGLPSLMFEGEEFTAVALPTKDGGIYNFAAANIFVNAAVSLLQHGDIDSLGLRHENLMVKRIPKYIEQEGQYLVYIHHIDNYGNAYLGLTLDEFEQLRAGRPFQFKIREHVVSEISTSYDIKKMNFRHPLLLTVSATGHLELAIYEDSFAQRVGVVVAGTVILRFG